LRSVLARSASARGRERTRLRAEAVALALAAEVALVGATARILVGWPPHVLDAVAAAAVVLPLPFIVEGSARISSDAPALLVHSVRLLGLTALVVALYAVVVLGLGRPPSRAERTTLALSLLAAGLAAALYVAARPRLTAFASRLSRGPREPPDAVLQRFGARLSREVPLEELLLELAESLRAALALENAEIWTGAAGALERVASEPDIGHATLRLTAAEEAVVARARISGPAHVRTWLPQLLGSGEAARVRVAAIASNGELLGLIVARRAPDDEDFDERAERVLADLARQVGLALRNVRLDSDLQASLDELRRQADELRVSRARIVAAADAERRRIERDFHDGAQQYLVGIAVNLRVARALADSDPERAKLILDELRGSVPAAIEEFRDLAHGIYPPLLQDQGLGAALAHAARRATIPTRVSCADGQRYDADVEAAVYFCCLEALQNAAKHAGDGAHATVRVWEDAGVLFFDVADDGSGFAATAARAGAGLTNMADRLGSIGGRLRVDSTPGDGTRIAGSIPLRD
jgi:signal transduction histidine kinase